jgi:membrane protease YdiL (CAAX protease family)
MQHALAIFLIFVVPVWDAWYIRRLKRSTDPRRKLRVYAVTMAWVWAASALAWWMVRPGFFFRLRPGARPGWLPGGEFLPGFVTGLCIAFAVALLLPVVLVYRSEKARQNLRRALSSLSFFLPVTRSERWLFAGVSITAGICEETLYRGFLMHYFGDERHLTVVAGVVLSSFVFGIAHEYQGIRGMIGAGVLGMVFAMLYLLTGSLLLPMVLHAAIDLRILLFPRDAMVGDLPDRNAV